MKPDQLELLPAELLQRVCWHLDYAALASFSLTSKTCRAVTVSFLFETASIYIFDPESLAVEIDTWNKVLASNNCQGHVKRVKIEDRAPRSRGPYLQMPKETHLMDYPGNVGADLISQGDILDGFGRVINLHKGMEDDDAWKPVVQFVGSLPGLRRIRYTCSDRLPQCLVDTLLRLQPKCKLEMIPTDLRIDESRSEPYFAASLVGSCLDNLCLVCDDEPSESGGYTGYYRNLNRIDQVLQSVNDVGESLIHWKIPEAVGFRDGFPRFTDPASHHTYPVIYDFEALRTTTTRLQIRVSRGNTRDCLDYWSRRFDYREVKALRLEGQVTQSTLTYLNSSFDFSSIQSLILLTWSFETSSSQTVHFRNYHERFATFLRGLNPLQILRISGSLAHNTVAAVLHRHGSTLRQLTLESHSYSEDFIMDDDLLRMLCHNCTSLESLQLPLKRTKGDESEVAQYVMLGSISTLRALQLTLNTTKPYPGPSTSSTAQRRSSSLSLRPSPAQSYRTADPSFTDFDLKTFCPSNEIGTGVRPSILYGHIRDYLINSAIDILLAQAIFELVALRNPQTRLRRFVIDTRFTPPTDHALHSSSAVRAILTDLGRSYFFTRELGNEVHIQELSWPARQSSSGTSHMHVDAYEHETCRSIMHRVWPPRKLSPEAHGNDEKIEEEEGGGEETKQHSSTWHSFPLILSEEIRQEMQTRMREIGGIHYINEDE